MLDSSDDSCSIPGMTTVVLDTVISDETQRVVVEHYLKRKINCVRSFRIVGKLFSSDGYRSPTLRGLRSLLECIKEMASLEEMDLCGDMHFENPHDIQILSDSLRNHPSLRSIKIRSFLVYTRRDPGSVPLLDPLLESVKSIQNLREFHVSCGAVYWNGTISLLSTGMLQSFCQSTSLEALTLSGVKLNDDHFTCLARELSPQLSLTEVVLNRNINTNEGIRAIAETLLSKDSRLTRLEMHNSTRASKSTSEFLRKQLYANHSIQHFRMNSRFEYRAEMDFILLLNRNGRKTILDPQASMQEVLSAFRAASANSNVSGLMYFLQSNPGILQNRRDEMKELADTKNPAVHSVPSEQLRPDWSNASKNGLGGYLKTWWKVET
ncbi:hypothetical protein IV203_005337 [Nitzschia inconspicua]|uniref:Uncharacterized protein n=1 Tax=Nitzschia inconspicua TaxID=303405 RepID=A0A9K3KNA4_9STRA|nr:hypothetical protein IV203_005337 [Nitzschia inconspicua]